MPAPPFHPSLMKMEQVFLQTGFPSAVPPREYSLAHGKEPWLRRMEVPWAPSVRLFGERGGILLDSTAPAARAVPLTEPHS